MGAVEPLGHEPLDPLAEQLLAGVPEDALHLLVHEHDAAGLVDAHDGVGGGLEQLLEPALGRLAVGDVTNGGDRERAGIDLDARQADLAGNSLPSLRTASSARSAPIGRVRGSAR